MIICKTSSNPSTTTRRMAVGGRTVDYDSSVG
jgi:hypothetical protein